MADDRHAVTREVEGGADRDPEHEREQAARDAREPALAREQEHERADPDRERRAVRVPEVREHVRELADRVPCARFDPEQLRQLLHGDEDRQPEDEALHHGPREELRDETETEQAREHEQTATEEDERGRVDEIRVRSARVERDHGGGEQHRRRGRTRRDDMPARPEDGVRRERDEQGVEPGLRRQAGEPGVGDHLRDQQAPDRRAGDDVEAEVAPVVGRQPGQDRDEASDPRRRRRRPGTRVDPGH